VTSTPASRLAAALASLALTACATSNLPPPPSSVSRTHAVATAARCASHRWFPSSANVFHGADPDGIRVDTPDVSWHPDHSIAGWWHPNSWNTGLPYQWGGFSSPEQFDRDLANGLAAGDVYTPEKRRLLDAAVSRHATGIDCSGLISLCWNLPRSYSTRELPSLCSPLPSWDLLAPGDILNTHNSHVLLFTGWANHDHSRLHVCEAGLPPHWLVVQRTAIRSDLERLGFLPWRYRGIKN
jgi:hypothetical protein